MDALRIQEQSGVPHASGVPGVMHACGHDGHVAMALAAAKACTHLPTIDGTVHFIFQPAEEAEGGGQRMVEQGLFQMFPCDSIYAMHSWPGLPVGTCVARDGAMMAALALFEIEVCGRGSHGAMPHQGTDPIVAACQLVCALQGIVARNVDPLATAVVSATQVHAGDAWNVIPDSCVIRGSTRWFDERIGDVIQQRLTQLSRSIASAFACEVRVKYERRCPATINDDRAAAIVRAVASKSPVNLTVANAEPSMASEDFAFMLNAIPGCYLWLGAGAGTHGLHSSHFDFNDDLLPQGVALWTSLVAHCLAPV